MRHWSQAADRSRHGAYLVDLPAEFMQLPHIYYISAFSTVGDISNLPFIPCRTDRYGVGPVGDGTVAQSNAVGSGSTSTSVPPDGGAVITTCRSTAPVNAASPPLDYGRSVAYDCRICRASISRLVVIRSSISPNYSSFS
ncbi:hypothetical protein SpAn4DRAFT_4152 [Sporomusa ovata]|uniref:Uncharacterized protein n=1 Tax=Sporomusa ovata TaxID=2378 RepID=A0A0U1L5L5_9FIRM|nr:hypothetical protein SpAn4DRAFT_4152 [Sporomusa ovata]